MFKWGGGGGEGALTAKINRMTSFVKLFDQTILPVFLFIDSPLQTSHNLKKFSQVEDTPYNAMVLLVRSHFKHGKVACFRPFICTWHQKSNNCKNRREK